MAAEATWYFAVGDEERGPVTEAQIRTLIGTGNLTRDDLVWREGLDDWLPAGEVPGLFDKEPAPAAAEPPAPRPNETPAPKGDHGVVLTPDALPPRRRPVTLPPALDLFRYWGFAAQPLLLVGFLMVLLSRGCDALAERDVLRAQSRPSLVENEFQDAWKEEKAALDAKLQELSKTSRTDATARFDIEKQINELDAQKEKELERLREGKWKRLEAAKRDAKARSEAWGFWREGFFWLGTLLFALGLLPVAFSGHGPSRWLAVVLLAIIVLRLYLRGGA